MSQLVPTVLLLLCVALAGRAQAVPVTHTLSLTVDMVDSFFPPVDPFGGVAVGDTFVATLVVETGQAGPTPADLATVIDGTSVVSFSLTIGTAPGALSWDESMLVFSGPFATSGLMVGTTLTDLSLNADQSFGGGGAPVGTRSVSINLDTDSSNWAAADIPLGTASGQDGTVAVTCRTNCATVPVPEPGPIGLVLAGLGAIAATRFRARSTGRGAPA